MKTYKQEMKKILTRKNLRQYLLSYHHRSIVGYTNSPNYCLISKYVKRSLELEYPNNIFYSRVNADHMWISSNNDDSMYLNNLKCLSLYVLPNWVKQFIQKFDKLNIESRKVTSGRALKLL
jgi:hypothetical protein